jgi:hypothetical protein
LLRKGRSSVCDTLMNARIRAPLSTFTPIGAPVACSGAPELGHEDCSREADGHCDHSPGA